MNYLTILFGSEVIFFVAGASWPTWPFHQIPLAKVSLAIFQKFIFAFSMTATKFLSA
jgi:hypothetical protein